MQLRLFLILIVALFSVSSTALVIRYVVTVPALTLAFWRMLTASMMLWSYELIEKKEALSAINRKRVFFAGIFLGLHFACFFLGVRYTSIANATLFSTLGPLFTSIIAFFQRKKTPPLVYLGLVLALTGVLINQYGDLSLSSDNLFGNALSLLSSFFIAITFIIAAKIRENTDNIVYGRSLFFVASITIAIISIFTNSSLFSFEKQHIFWFLFLGFVPSILGHNMLNYALKYFSPTAVVSVPLGEPIIASFFGYLIFKELIPASSLISAPIILGGVFLVLKNQDRT